MWTICQGDRELSSAPSLEAARVAVRTHLIDDEEEGPLEVFDPEGAWAFSGNLADHGALVYTAIQRRQPHAR